MNNQKKVKAPEIKNRWVKATQLRIKRREEKREFAYIPAKLKKKSI
jgi:hypothetical protein